MSKEQTAEEILYKYYKTWFNKTFAGAISENLFRETSTYSMGIAAMEEYATLKLQEEQDRNTMLVGKNTWLQCKLDEQAKEIEALKLDIAEREKVIELQKKQMLFTDSCVLPAKDAELDEKDKEIESLKAVLMDNKTINDIRITMTNAEARRIILTKLTNH